MVLNNNYVAKTAEDFIPTFCLLLQRDLQTTPQTVQNFPLAVQSEKNQPQQDSTQLLDRLQFSSNLYKPLPRKHETLWRN